MSITIQGTAVPTSAVGQLQYGEYAAEGPVEIRIADASGDLICSGGESRMEGNTLCIAVTDPQPIFVWHPEREDVGHILLWPRRELYTPADMIPCEELGVKAGPHIQTAALQHAVDTLSAKGGTIRFSPGTYRTGTLYMRSGVSLHLDEDAVIQGTDDPADYPLDAGTSETGTNGEHMTFSRLILFDGVHDVSLSGKGTIRGGGKRLRERGRSANLIRIKNSRNITIRDLILSDAAAWSVHILHSDDVTVTGVKILNDLSNRNTDGVDPDSSQNITVQDCIMYCGDDCVVVKTTRNGGLLRPSRHILARDNVFYTLKAAQKIGTETFADIRDVTFSGNRVVRADRAMGIYCCDGGNISDISFRNTVEEHVNKIMEVQTRKRNGLGLVNGVTVT